MIPHVRYLALVAASVFLLSAAPALADEPQSPAPDPLPPVRAVPPPMPEPDPTEESGETVLGSHVSHGGYGAPALKLSTLGGDALMLAGGEGGWIIGHSLVLGAAGYGSATTVTSPTTLQSASGNARLGIGYGGFRLGGVLGAFKRTHATLGLLVGGGSATSSTSNNAFRQSDTFFVVEPDLAAEINLAKRVHLAIGGSYRFVGGTDVAGFTATRLSGPAGTLTLRFGEF